MQKIGIVYRAAGPMCTTAAEAVQRAHDGLAPCCEAVTLHVRDADFPAHLITAGGFDRSIVAGLTLWVQRAEELETLRGALDQIGPSWQAYSLVESVIREYPKIDWPLGTKSPGVTLFALIRQGHRIGREEFFRLWHEHSRLSVQLHPLTRYHRNAVLRQFGADRSDCDGIIEERVGSVEDLAPDRFYLGEGAMDAAVRSLSAYVDLEAGGLACALLDEYLIKLPRWLAPAPTAASPASQTTVG